jgi:hypothetical protein
MTPTPRKQNHIPHSQPSSAKVEGQQSTRALPSTHLFFESRNFRFRAAQCSIGEQILSSREPNYQIDNDQRGQRGCSSSQITLRKSASSSIDIQNPPTV